MIVLLKILIESIVLWQAYFIIYYFGARYYDPSIGRWLTTDAVGQYFSPYVYCGNNPVIMVDPDGDISFLAALGIGMGIGAITGGIYAYYQGMDWKGIGKYALGGAAFGAIGGAFTAGGIAWLSGGSVLAAAKWGAIGGGAFGGFYGAFMGAGGVYEGRSGFGNMAVDLTWSFPNTFIGFSMGMVDVGIGKLTGLYESSYKFEAGKGLIIEGALGKGLDLIGFYAITFGPTIWTANKLDAADLRHEFTHTLQQRIFGPTFIPLYASNDLGNLSWVWAKKKSYYSWLQKAYYYNLFEIWARSEELRLRRITHSQ